ncbi:bcl-2-like protein 11 isoform X1 [Narcine bancroftii]|uniref:bcl-2-like protein 11 isoform X1 n=1 Tax=Narcine bancroftii TaxID=1343680 RepID=UPI003831CF41
MTMPMGHNQSTQTPSLACQAIHHAQHTLAQVQRLLNSGPQHVQIQGSSESLPMDVPIELWIGQELRRIGDEFVSIRIQAMNHRLPYNHMRNLWHWINAWLRRRRIDG